MVFVMFNEHMMSLEIIESPLEASYSRSDIFLSACEMTGNQKWFE